MAALREFGLLDRSLSFGARIVRLDGRDVTGRRAMRMSYETWKPGAFGLGIHRASLFDVLHDAVTAVGVEVVTKAQIVRIDDYKRPTLVALDDREFGAFDLAVIADGSGSNLRAQVRPGARAPLYPWGAVFANAEDRDGQFAAALHQRYARSEVMIGILPVGRRSPGSSEEVSFFWSVRRAEMDGFFASDFETWRSRVLSIWPEAEPVVRQFASAAAFSRAVYRDVRVGRWSRGAVVLIGDAAHATSPQLGQGANLALLDAFELAERVEAPSRLVAYQRARRLQTGPYQLLSRLLTPLFQSRGWFWPRVRNWLFAPLSQAPGLRWHSAHVLTGTFRFARTPKRLRP
jgi:2-polyprenyl-6-methoxyphenol hydroxylase-like FAD-dependent oxidoreductase